MKRYSPRYGGLLFLFDGEEIKELADKTEEDTAQQIKESIEAILGLRILRTLQEDLTKVQNDYAREGSNESSDLSRKSIGGLKSRQIRTGNELKN